MTKKKKAKNPIVHTMTMTYTIKKCKTCGKRITDYYSDAERLNIETSAHLGGERCRKCDDALSRRNNKRGIMKVLRGAVIIGVDCGPVSTNHLVVRTTSGKKVWVNVDQTLDLSDAEA